MPGKPIGQQWDAADLHRGRTLLVRGLGEAGCQRERPRPAEYRDLVPVDHGCGKLDPAKCLRKACEGKFDSVLASAAPKTEMGPGTELKVPIIWPADVKGVRFPVLLRVAPGRADR